MSLLTTLVFMLYFFLPGIFGIMLFINFNKEKKGKELSLYYLLLTFFSNLITMIILILINKAEYDVILDATNNFSFWINYSIISVILNFILSIVFSVIIKYITFSIEVEHENKKCTKKN